MAESSVPIDLFNPGQVFACLGIVEAADVLLGGAAGAFDWADSQSRFFVSAHGREPPVERVLRFLEEAEISTRAPAGWAHLEKWSRKWGEVPPFDKPGDPFPMEAPDSPATLPVVLRAGASKIVIDYWGSTAKPDNVKFWAGSRGKPGVVLFREALKLVRGKTKQHVGDPFSLKARQTSSFRFDWRRDYIPLDLGFSPNEHRRKHGRISMMGFPLVEVLAAIGVSNARPKRVGRLEYRYSVLGGRRPLEPLFLRAALGATTSPLPGVPTRHFTMQLDWPGREGHARCITQVTEERQSD